MSSLDPRQANDASQRWHPPGQDVDGVDGQESDEQASQLFILLAQVCNNECIEIRKLTFSNHVWK